MAARSEANRWVPRACAAGLLAVLCFLAGFSLLTENDLTTQAVSAQRSAGLGQLYGDARFWVGQEESLERKYRLEPGSAVLQLHTAARANLARDLGSIRRLDPSPATTRLVAYLGREQRRYTTASQRMFGAADRHDTSLVIRYDHGLVDPIFGAIERTVYARSASSAVQSRLASGRLRAGTASARTAIAVAFTSGLLLLLGFTSILVSLRRRVRGADRAEIDRLAGVALTDSLTGLHNHRAFHEDLARKLKRGAYGTGCLALIMFDLDDLKTLNDTHGHQAGDESLQGLARALAECFRDADRAYRVGGDEFAVILPNRTPWDALEATQRLQTALAPAGIRVTAGIADGSPPADVDGLIRKADVALIAGKRQGHAVTVFSAELQPTVAAPDAAREAEYITGLSSALAHAVDAKDSYTRSHCQTVSQLCALIAAEIGLTPSQISQMRLAGLLHDVGKIGIPDAILTKPDALTPAEFELMKRHSVLGEEIVAAAGLNTEANWVRHHHERYDGTGYPDRLSAEEIPIQSRIILVADAFEAMTSDRPYRLAPGRTFAMAELDRHAGTQFDPDIVHAFVRTIGTGHAPTAPRTDERPLAASGAGKRGAGAAGEIHGE